VASVFYFKKQKMKINKRAYKAKFTFKRKVSQPRHGKPANRTHGPLRAQVEAIFNEAGGYGNEASNLNATVSGGLPEVQQVMMIGELVVTIRIIISCIKAECSIT
jgi:hypothetical protein